jgi:hypothetical protein
MCEPQSNNVAHFRAMCENVSELTDGDGNTFYLFPTHLVVGLGKTHGPTLAEDPRPYSGVTTNYESLSDWTIE